MELCSLVVRRVAGDDPGGQASMLTDFTAIRRRAELVGASGTEGYLIGCTAFLDRSNRPVCAACVRLGRIQ
jgi:hypothetical protein